ncbi:PEP-CTERM sorting domain-containing protein [Lacimicrobium alkaliphilum]|uniref:Ice-binding protein C-terminal domain-containing protein n=1 Tax=Lacimicrobium alkaliphilum TaxID=1526571 RepID=A0A0U2ZGF3_9ALTE|nr:PEP-CTERM sorting domain-containing protein [Lacimicrobium alkaliphilum]ALS98087.1 hypothetical protein AT746_07290 [Lacimicrobium alkaliphilum]
MLSKYTVPVTLGLLALAGFSSSAHAGVITQRSAIETVILADTSGSHLLETDTANSAYTQSYEDSSTSLALRADTSTGVVGASSYSKGGSGQALVTIFDTIEFSGLLTPTTISYNFGVDGSFYTDSIFDSAYFQSYVRIYDITGMQSWLETESFFGIFDDTDPVESANEISYTGFYQSAQDGDYGLYSFDEVLSGSFVAEQGRTYGVAILANAYASGDNAYTDFLNTSTFSFTDLGGATFTSGSGAFLSPTSVPEPSSLAILGLGLAALGFRRIKQS